MPKPDYTQAIKKRIMSTREYRVFVTPDFLDIAPVSAINKALSRLAQEGFVRRIVRGVYDRPGYNRLLGRDMVPHVETVARAIARDNGWTIVPDGDTALNMLGLSTQVPAFWSYVSDGPYKTYSVGNSVIKFKHTTNRNITGMSPRSALVVQALKVLGNEAVDEKIIRELSSHLSRDDKRRLLREAQYSTAWIFSVIKEICKEKNEADE